MEGENCMLCYSVLDGPFVRIGWSICSTGLQKDGLIAEEFHCIYRLRCESVLLKQYGRCGASRHRIHEATPVDVEERKKKEVMNLPRGRVFHYRPPY